MLPLNRPPTHPGEFLSDFMQAAGLTQASLAVHLSWTQPKVSEIVKARRGITPETALSFSDAFGNSPEFWLNAQRDWDLWHARQQHRSVPRIA